MSSVDSELPDDDIVERERREPTAATCCVDCSDPEYSRKSSQAGSFAALFIKLKRILDRSVEPKELKEFLRYYSNPTSPEHCLVDEQLYSRFRSTSKILDSLHPTYINFKNYHLLQEIVDNYGSEPSKKLLRDYKSQWE